MHNFIIVARQEETAVPSDVIRIARCDTAQLVVCVFRGRNGVIGKLGSPFPGGGYVLSYRLHALSNCLVSQFCRHHDNLDQSCGRPISLSSSVPRTNSSIHCFATGPGPPPAQPRRVPYCSAGIFAACMPHVDWPRTRHVVLLGLRFVGLPVGPVPHPCTFLVQLRLLSAPRPFCHPLVVDLVQRFGVLQFFVQV